MVERLFTSIEEKRKAFDVLFQWDAPERNWEPRDRGWYVLYSAFFIVIIAALAILQKYILIIAVVAFVFLWFTQAAIPPEITTHRITSIGVKAYGKLYRWADIEHYWFSFKGDTAYLNLDVLTGDFVEEGRRQRISLIIDITDQEEIFFLLIRLVDYGDKDEVNYNILTQILHGKYVDINVFLPDDVPDQESFLNIEDSSEQLPQKEIETIE